MHSVTFLRVLISEPYVEYTVLNSYGDEEMICASCLYKFMRSYCGKVLSLIMSIFGLTTMLESISWLLTDIVYLDIIKKVSMSNDLSVPALTKNGADEPSFNIENDK